MDTLFFWSIISAANAVVGIMHSTMISASMTASDFFIWFLPLLSFVLNDF